MLQSRSEGPSRRTIESCERLVRNLSSHTSFFKKLMVIGIPGLIHKKLFISSLEGMTLPNDLNDFNERCEIFKE
jgi:hypothetical protein